MLRFLMMAAIFSILIMISSPSVDAANVDDELSIMAAEQRKDNDADVTVTDDIETFDNQPQSEPQQQSSSTRDDSNSSPPSSQEFSPSEPHLPTQSAENLPDSPVQPSQQDQSQDTPQSFTPSPSLRLTQTQQSPVTNYANFAEASKKVGFIPLYVPRKSGYAMNNISVINDNIIELRYGRRWEPTVTLAIRTYKRAPNEQVKDISGISGVKWKVDLSSGLTLYIARINDKNSVAAWSVGQYTFAAMTENLSFAAFHAFIVEELVDLCNHYFIDIT